MATKLIDQRAPGRALKIYLILIGAAVRNETVSLHAIRREIGLEHQDRPAFWPYFNRIAVYCKNQGWPDITYLVVDRTGKPSESPHGKSDPSTAQARQQAAWRHDWLNYAPPTVEDLTPVPPRRIT